MQRPNYSDCIHQNILAKWVVCIFEAPVTGLVIKILGQTSMKFPIFSIRKKNFEFPTMKVSASKQEKMSKTNETSPQIHVLKEFRPFLRLIKAFSANKFRRRDGRRIARSVAIAAYATVAFFRPRNGCAGQQIFVSLLD